MVKLLSRVIMDLADGEVKQGLFRFDTAQSFETYPEKSYCKTASLIANSARAAGVLSDCSPTELDGLYRLGRQLGLAFQVVDDISISPAATSNSANQLPVTGQWLSHGSNLLCHGGAPRAADLDCPRVR